MAVALLIVVVAAFAGAGCADEADHPASSTDSRGDRANAPVRPDNAADKGATETTPAGAEIAQTATNTDTGRKVIRKPSGAVTITPERPTTYKTRPEKRCGSRVVGVFSRDGKRIIGTRRVAMPPRPGVAAERIDDDTVVVSYDLGTVDPTCRPAFLEMTVDINDDGQSGTGVVLADRQSSGGFGYARIRQPQGEIVVEVPDYMREADVFIASVRTRDGRPSNDSSRVLIGD
jgi:hypothetical protein